MVKFDTRGAGSRPSPPDLAQLADEVERRRLRASLGRMIVIAEPPPPRLAAANPP